MLKILIVDDEMPARDYIAGLVASFLPDAEIVKIDEPQKALEYLQNETVDIMFLDVCMPEMTGLEVLEYVRCAGNKTFTVIVSAHREFDYAVKGMELGVVRYITKPLHAEKVHEIIRQYQQLTKNRFIEVKTPCGVRRLEIDSILAIEIADRTKVKVYTSDGVIPYAVGTLSGISAFLPPHFQYIRRNCILNINTVESYNLKCNEVVIVCKNEKITLKGGREYMKKLRVIKS